MNEFIVLITILFTSGVGYAVIRGFQLLPVKENLSAIGFSYGLGLGLISTELYIYSRLHIPWHITLLIFPWIIFFAVIIIKEKKSLAASSLKITKFTRPQKLLLIGIIITFAYVIFEALIRPVTVWDAWAIWLLKSKIFFIDGYINPEMLNYVKSDYPLIISLFGTFVYIVLGHVNDTAVLLTSVAFYFFLGLSLFAVLKKEYGVTYALLFTFLFATTQNFIRHGGRLEAGQADLPVGYFTFVSTLLLFNYLKKSNGKTLILLNMFLGILSLVKFEGIPIAIVIDIFVLYQIFKNKVYNHLWFLLLWFIPVLDWQLYKKLYDLKYNYFEAHTLIFSQAKFINAIWGTIRELINVKTWNLLWIIYLCTLFLGIKKNNYFFILNVIIFSQIFLYIGIYTFTLGNDPESSAERLLVHIAPLALYCISIIVIQAYYGKLKR